MNRTVYSHPDGFALAFNDNTLIATDDDGKAVSLPIGPLGLVELGNALLALTAEREGYQMTARLYALAWRVLPYVCCLPAGATLGFLLLQFSGSAK